MDDLVRTRPVLKMSACLAVAILLGACSSGPSGSPKPTDKSNTTPTTATTAQSTGPSTATSFAHVTGPSLATIDSSKTVTVGGRTVKVLTDSGKPITTEDGDGQQIIISAAGFLPLKLYSTPSVPVVSDQPDRSGPEGGLRLLLGDFAGHPPWRNLPVGRRRTPRASPTTPIRECARSSSSIRPESDNQRSHWVGLYHHGFDLFDDLSC